MSANGRNPLRWNCLEDGCFNHKLRPKIEVFSDCFPGNINFGDVDGIVEIAGRALLLEWKSEVKEIPRGQAIMYERITATGFISAIILVGNARDMTVTHRRCISRGIIGEWKPCDLATAQTIIKRWADRALEHPNIPKPDLQILHRKP